VIEFEEFEPGMDSSSCGSYDGEANGFLLGADIMKQEVNFETHRSKSCPFSSKTTLIIMLTIFCIIRKLNKILRNQEFQYKELMQLVGCCVHIK